MLYRSFQRPWTRPRVVSLFSYRCKCCLDGLVATIRLSVPPGGRAYQSAGAGQLRGRIRVNAIFEIACDMVLVSHAQKLSMCPRRLQRPGAIRSERCTSIAQVCIAWQINCGNPRQYLNSHCNWQWAGTCHGRTPPLAFVRDEQARVIASGPVRPRTTP